MTALAIRNMEQAARALERAMGWDALTHNAPSARTPRGPAMDIIERGDTYEMRIDLPGASRDGINIESSSGVLTVSGKLGEHEFRRSVALPSWADIEKIGARLENGVLSISVPKRDEQKPRVITIQ